MSEFNKDNFSLRHPSPGARNQHGRNTNGTRNPDLDPFAASPGVANPLDTTLQDPSRGLREPHGMFVGPGDPLFTNAADSQHHPGQVFGGPQSLPPGAVPPGARFDSIGPFGPIPGMPVRPHMGQMPNPNGANMPFSGEPDNDELPPPKGAGYQPPFM